MTKLRELIDAGYGPALLMILGGGLVSVAITLGAGPLPALFATGFMCVIGGAIWWVANN